MIAYDMDGVIVSDILFEEDIKQHLEKRYAMFPIFVPQGHYCLITGRPALDRDLTEKWIVQYLTNAPVVLFHNNSLTGDPAEYKIKVINSNPMITIFIESDRKQADTIRKSVVIPVFLFSELIEEAVDESRL